MLVGQKILLTGLTGSLGGSIASGLTAENDVWGFARYTRAGQREFWQGKGIHTVAGDCADGIFGDLPTDFDYVIHCAAANPPETFLDGMRGNPQATALLMGHCSKAKGFMHFSSVGVYSKNSDPDHEYREDDLTGSSIMGHYEGTKLAAEGAAWGMSNYLKLPTVICRLGVQYGWFYRGGLLGTILKALLDGETIFLPKRQTNMIRPISDEDVVGFLEPLFEQASVAPTVVNLAGDEDISTMEIIDIFGEMSGVVPKVELTDAFDYPTIRVNSDLRRKIAGDCKVPLREGIRRMYQMWRRR